MATSVPIGNGQEGGWDIPVGMVKREVPSSAMVRVRLINLYQLEITEPVDSAVRRVGEAYMTCAAVAAYSVAPDVAARFGMMSDETKFDARRVRSNFERHHDASGSPLH